MPAPTQLTHKFKINVDGRAIDEIVDRAVVTVTVDDSRHLPDLFIITFRDPDRDVLSRAGIRIGSEVSVTVFSTDSPGGESLITGEVTAVEAEFDQGTGTLTIVRGYDASHRLFRGRITESYADMTYADIARTVAQRVGLPIGTIDATTPIHKHVSQVNQNDWDFLWMLAREVGYEVAVLDGKLDFRTPTASADGPEAGTLAGQDPLELTYGANLLSLSAAITSAEQVADVEVRGWDMTQKKELIGTAPAETASSRIGATPAELAALFGNRTYVAADTPFVSQPEVDAVAKATAEQIAGGFAELHGVARGNPKLRAGTAVSLGLVKEPFDGKYTLTSTRHVYDPLDSYTVRFTASGRQERSLLGLTTSGTNGHATRINGVVTALVTDVRDPEKLGRVKLTFPWLSGTYVSDWTRTMQLGAGKERGTLIVPEVGDEVLVAFDRGDVRHPYVIGGLYNGINVPDESAREGLVDSASGAINFRGIESRKDQLLILFDKDSSEGILLKTEVGGRYFLSLFAAKRKVTLHSDGRVIIEGKGSVSVNAGGDLELSGSKVKIKGAGGVDIDGGPTVTVTGSQIKLN